MEIMTFNINKYRNYKDKDLGIKEIVGYIAEFIDNNDDNIALIQELPYANGDETLYKKTVKLAEEKHCKIIIPPNFPEKTNSVVCAMLKYDNNKWELDMQRIIADLDSEDYSNHFIELEYKNNEETEIKLMGIHMPLPQEEEGKTQCKLIWHKIIEKSAKMKDKRKPFIIAGDFNAHRHSHRESTYEEYLSKFDGYFDCVHDETITLFGPQTTVDHVFCPSFIDAYMKSAEIKRFSDHAPIIIKIRSLDTMS